MKSINYTALSFITVSAASFLFSGCAQDDIVRIGNNAYSISGEVEDADDRSDLHEDISSFCSKKGLYSALIRERVTIRDGERFMIMDFRCITAARYHRKPMPKYIKHALTKKGLMKKYLERPEAQQSDYIGWIEGAGKEDEQDKRLNQMLDELKVGEAHQQEKAAPQTGERVHKPIMPK